MDIYQFEFNPVYINITQDIEGIEYTNVDKENSDTLIIEFENIPKDTKFNMWDKVDNYFDEYGARNGFAIIKYRMKQNGKDQIHKRTLVYEFNGTYKPKKSAEAALKGTQQNIKTKKLNRLWHINLFFPDQTTQISITIFVNKHNHILVPKT
ncbi:hypothetical protein RclHR1_15660002 [Rhizophagus clarus]|uniref:FAR1 domain-containing protein n=1 Tax=Rhizophagus clarus TaxID=94130 RepID=A0A2Z6QFU6_9GLOM|nr:hypothetical protein RclHR1_15660002 [Rhizophagus clarus]GES72525.1 hypothetical protein GLOIN_2v1765091 [Rhizophagus clarus]